MAGHALTGIEGFGKRSDMFHVDPRFIKVVDGWNDRTDFSGEEELMESIKSVGVKVPLRIKKTKDGELRLVDGERRLRATLRAIEEGSDIKTVPAIVAPHSINDIDLYLESIIANTGKGLTPTEEANSFKRLISWGLSVKEIASKTGRSETHVRNRLELSNAIPVVKKSVDEKEITVKDAQEIVKESDGNVEAQEKALEIKKITPKKKKKKPLTMQIRTGLAHYSGGDKDQTCEVVMDWIFDEDFRFDLDALGFDPDTIKVSIGDKE